MTLVYLNVKESDLEEFRNGLIAVKSQYEKARYSLNGLTLVLYNSGKLVVSGNEELLNDFKTKNFNLKLQTKKEDKKLFSNELPISEAYIGSDETLKGDTFGGLVVVAFYFKKIEENQLFELGVCDSKNLSDLQIEKIAKILLEKYPKNFNVLELKPNEYNQLLTRKSLTELLNEMHMKTALELKKENPKAVHIVDEYPGCNVGDFRITKAESHSLEVAAASIVARYVGLKQFENLSKRAGFILPKGSTHVRPALKLIKELNLPIEEFAKTSFKNVKEFL